MKSIAVVAAAGLALLAGPATAQDKTIKIGFISTFSGPAGAIGNDMSNAFELGLDHLGRKLGGLPVEVIYEDDQQKPEVGVQKDAKTARIRSRRLCRRLHLVERHAGLAEAADRDQDHHGDHQCWRVATRRRDVFALCVLDLVQQRSSAAVARPLPQSKGHQEGLYDGAATTRPAAICCKACATPIRANSSARR